LVRGFDQQKHVIVPRYKGKGAEVSRPHLRKSAVVSLLAVSVPKTLQNQKRYRVTVSGNALAWLKPHAKTQGSFLAISRAFQSHGKPSKRRTRELILDAANTADITFPDNAGRHTFISMHAAYYENIDKTALEADTSAEIIKSNYLDIVTRKEAIKFWAIRPSAK